MNRLRKLRCRLQGDGLILADCASRFLDGVTELQDPMPCFKYLRDQLDFLDERLAMVRAKLADYEREFVTPLKGGQS